MTTISNRMPACWVEYDYRGLERRVKKFTGEEAYKARAFYVAKLRSGKDPKVIKPKEESDEED